VEPIRRDLGISDTQMSLLMGLAFALFYTLLGVPIGRLADRYSRRGIIAIGIALWCRHDRRLRPGPQLRAALPGPHRRGRRRGDAGTPAPCP
jgi:MFS family permease